MRFQTLKRHAAAMALAVALSSGTVTQAGDALFQFQHLRSFGLPEALGLSPQGPLIEGGDGSFYGATAGNSPSDIGTVFKIEPDGSGYRVLHRFGSIKGEGIGPAGGILEASDGVLYGITARGGSNVFGGGALYGGTLYKLNKDGGGYRILHHFGSGPDGENPRSGLIEGLDGALYGTTADGGSNRGGTVFRLNKDGSGYTNLHDFDFFAQPIGGLIAGAGGWLYGTTERDGARSAGTVFRLRGDGSGYSILHHFTGWGGFGGDDGAYPGAPLLLASDGLLYGTSRIGGATNSGTVFRLSPDGSEYRILHSFNIYDSDGSYPECQLVEGTNGMLYGTVPNGGGSVFRIAKDGTGFTVLHRFRYDNHDGNYPIGGLLESSNGLLYGATSSGGSNGVGIIFSMALDGGGYRVVRDFVYGGGDGVGPERALIEGVDGRLYGTTQYGGIGDCQGPSGQRGCGTVFRLNSDGSDYTILRRFANSPNEGQQPVAELLQGSDGWLYGTTYVGGASNAGTIFKIGPDGSGFTQLHSFANPGSGGSRPKAGLIQDHDGLLYGTTSSGGNNFAGTVFRINTNGSGYAVLHTFASQDGRPEAKLFEASDGLLYGVTYEGGSNGLGGVFRLSKTGQDYRVLHSFDYDQIDGIRPGAGLIEGTDGRLYGTTTLGGTNNSGTVFGLNRDGTGYSVVRSFGPPYSGDGETPTGGLIETKDGTLYGTTAYGGDPTISLGMGTVFKLNKDGSGYASSGFASDSLEGGNPRSHLIQSSDGALYGTARTGGRLGLGAVYRLLKPLVIEPLIRPQGEGLRFVVRGHPGLQVRIERSIDLTNWESWQIVTLPDAPMELIDPDFSMRNQLFYRGVFP